MQKYKGAVYLTRCEQWSWQITHMNKEVLTGKYYAAKSDAINALNIHLEAFERKNREQHIPNLRASYKLQKRKPSPADEMFYRKFIAAEATLDDFHNHAIELALEHADSNGDASISMLAAGHWITYYDDNLIPDVLLREWPDGTMEAVNIDENGDVFVEKGLPKKSELRRRRKMIRNWIKSLQLSGLTPSKEAFEKMEAYATSVFTWDEFNKLHP